MLYREITFDYVLQAVRRRKLAIALPAMAITVGAIALALILPNIYRTETMILVEPQQSVETQGGKPSITVSMERDLNTISQQILSRSHLEQIVTEYNLFPGSPMEQRVESMRDAIKLDIEHTDQNPTVSSFKISFQHREPQVATDVTNRLASLFIDENTTSREKIAGERAQFIEQQLAQTKAKLEEQENKIQEFKSRNLGELPEQRDANLKMMEQLNAQLMANNDALNRASQQRVYLETMLAQYQVAPKSVTQRQQNYPGEPPLLRAQTQIEKQLEDLKANLAELRSKYTDQHPDVIRTTNQIAEMEQKRAAEKAAEKNTTVARKSGSSKPNSANDKDTTENAPAPEHFAAMANITSQLRSIKAEIDERGRASNSLQQKLNTYQSRLELSPALEQQLAGLNREYAMTKESYEALSNESKSSKMAQDLERQQKTMLFRVVDPAKLPEKPVKPDRRAIALFGLLAGLGAGLGFAFYREFTDESLRTEKEIETALGIDVLAVIPRVAL